MTNAKIYAMPNIHQVYFFDPNANIIEVNQNINWIEISFIHPLNKLKYLGIIILSELFKELDYQKTPLGEVSLRRRKQLKLNKDIFEVILNKHIFFLVSI